jgi:hypothetical protein
MASTVSPRKPRSPPPPPSPVPRPRCRPAPRQHRRRPRRPRGCRDPRQLAHRPGFPQETMLADRRAAIEGPGMRLADGIALEAESGPPTLEVALRGASRFAAGEGRGGIGAGVRPTRPEHTWLWSLFSRRSFRCGCAQARGCRSRCCRAARAAPGGRPPTPGMDACRSARTDGRPLRAGCRRRGRDESPSLECRSRGHPATELPRACTAHRAACRARPAHKRRRLLRLATASRRARISPPSSEGDRCSGAPKAGGPKWSEGASSDHYPRTSAANSGHLARPSGPSQHDDWPANSLRWALSADCFTRERSLVRNQPRP